MALSGPGKRFFSSKWLLLASLFILVFFSVNLVREFVNRRDLDKDINVLEEQINSLESKNQELAGLIDYFKSLDFVEKEARTKLNLRKPGEQIIIVPKPETASSASPALLTDNVSSIVTPETKTLTNPERWWQYFFKITTN